MGDDNKFFILHYRLGGKLGSNNIMFYFKLFSFNQDRVNDHLGNESILGIFLIEIRQFKLS